MSSLERTESSPLARPESSPLARPESALLVRAAAVEPMVARHRGRYDPAAAMGVPAHLTVAYPFKPTPLLTGEDVAALGRIFARFASFTVVFARTARFGDEVLYLEPLDPEPLADLTAAVEVAFPQYPIYGGVHPDLRPHLTVAVAQPSETVAAVERELGELLPVEQPVSEIELWHRLPPDTGHGRWEHLHTFPLAGADAPAD